MQEFDTIARLETQAIDAYNDAHHYRAENPLAHLHEDRGLCWVAGGPNLLLQAAGMPADTLNPHI